MLTALLRRGSYSKIVGKSRQEDAMNRKEKAPQNNNKGNAMRERAETKSVKAKEHLKDAAEQTKEELADVTDTITNKRGQKDKNYRQ